MAEVWRSSRRGARLLRFGLVGGATSAGYVLAVALLAGVMAEPLAAAIAYLALVPVNYLGHRRATFRSRAPGGPELLRYLAAHGATMLACMAAMHLVVAAGGSHWAGSAVILLLAPAMNFLLLDLWVFRRGRP